MQVKDELQRKNKDELIHLVRMMQEELNAQKGELTSRQGYLVEQEDQLKSQKIRLNSLEVPFI